ncbi:MAG TPA: serine/threonine-protein kinase [Chitinispirillaceae bacterium]|nr:serine/threonine-protein kinase [Chitinispirillaceae bacterium]
MENSTSFNTEMTIKRLHNTVVLPDGTRNEPMGSGYITGILGTGGMANVYEIWNPQLEINRAVKLLHPNYTPEAKQRFETEIKITARLQHPNIVEIHYVGEWNGLPYIEMEKINGVTLETLIMQRGALPVEVITSIGITICRALRFAHNQEYVIYGKTYNGVIHRDLKPSNIMITFKGILKLMDFGIARPTDASLLTTDGAILGTIQYLSPEQLEGGDADIRSDIYSIGTVLYELITGEKTFPEQNVSKLMMAKVKNEYLSLDLFNARIPQKIKKLIHRCLMQNPDRRYQDTTELLSDLTRIHKIVSTKTPEQVLKNFINEISGERVVLSLKGRFPVPIIAVASLVAVSVIVFSYVASSKMLRSSKNVTIPVTSSDTIAAADSLVKVSYDKKENLITSQKSASLNVTAKSRAVLLSKGKAGAAKVEQILSENKSESKKKIAVSLYDSLRVNYATDDLTFIIERELQSKKYNHVLLLYDTIISRGPADPKVVMCKLRALRQLNNRVGIRKLLSEHNVQDGEFILEKARMKYNEEDITSALELLKECSRTPAAFIDGKQFRLEYLYLAAKCKSKQFDMNPDVEHKNEALGAWFDLKAELQTSQDHSYFKNAEKEMQRITSKVTVSQR